MLKIGIALDRLEILNWKRVLIEKMELEPSFSIEAILLPQNIIEPIKGLWIKHMEIDEKYFTPNPEAFRRVDCQDRFSKTVQLTWTNIEAIQLQKLDVIFWLSSEEKPVNVFKAAKYGVLFFKNGFEHNTHESLLGYWEFVQMHEVLTSVLLFQDNEQELFKIADTWSMMPTMSISRARNEHAWKLVNLGLRGVSTLLEIDEKDLEFFSRPYQKPGIGFCPTLAPTNTQALFNLIRHAYRFGFKALRKLFYKEQWILLIDQQKGPSTNFSKFKKIMPPKDRFWADPFLVPFEDKQFLFFEELPFATDKGHLSVMEIGKNGKGSNPVKILEEPFHLSYPFVFQYEGKYYMIPESYQDKSIRLYECVSFPYKWEYKKNIMNNVSAFDTTLYFHRGKWWMFTLIMEQEGGGHNDELFLFYADSPLTDEWTSHPQNPIVSDVRVARPAGNIYEYKGRLIRPSQDCAKKYGYGFNLNEILEMTETNYSERRLLHVRPDWDKTLTRTHSFNHVEDATVIDAVTQRSRFF